MENVMNIVEVISKELNIHAWQTETVMRLLDEGNTIPFIARYRKEATGGLDDGKLRDLETRLTYLKGLEERRTAILASVEEQGKLTDALKKEIEEAATLTRLEDLYLPFRPKRRTRAMIAKEKGLEPLAGFLKKHPEASAQQEASRFVDPGKGIPDPETAIRMAEDIIAEELSEDAKMRAWIREKTVRSGLLTSKRAVNRAGSVPAARDRESVYENYYDYAESIGKIPGHRILALNRGEKEKYLSVGIEAPAEEILSYMENRTRAGSSPYLKDAVRDAYKRLIAPSVETQIRRELTEKAEDGAMKVFAGNLAQLLMQPPIDGKTVLGWDPAFRTGCKLAVVDETGKVLATDVIYPTAPHEKIRESEETLHRLCEKYGIDLISLGNGTASRESEKVIADFIRKEHSSLKYVIVNEAGASVYSAGKLAAEEFPSLDVGLRSAASIARRLQDPLAELVKIDPCAIGVGQYQHDMDQARLSKTLQAVVEDCVNRAGVDLNTASAPLLSYISGITRSTAENIVSYREANGRFVQRRDLKKVKGLGPKAFEQCAGFLRIRGGKEILDMTGIHPESYEAARALLKELGFTGEDIAEGRTRGIASAAAKRGIPQLASATGLGEYTLRDVIRELEKPGRDPRREIAPPILRSDILRMEDLTPGMELQGTVRNIVDFGAFVDIGVHQDGLVHISELADGFVKHPLDVVKVGDIVKVKVLSADPSRKRISLTMKL